MDTTRRPGSIVRILAGIVLVAFAIYIAIGARAANGWAHPRRDSYLLATSASFNLEYQDVRFPSRDKEIEISGWWIPRAGSTKAIVMVHGRGENRTTEFYSHFLDLAAALNTFQGRGFNVLMIDLRAHGLSGGAESAWGITERHNVEAAVDWIKTRGFQAASIGALGGAARGHGLRLRHGRRSRHPRAGHRWRRRRRVRQSPAWLDAIIRNAAAFLFGGAPHGARSLRLRLAQAPPRRHHEAHSSSPGAAHLRPSGIARGQRPASPTQAALPDAELWVVPGAAHTGAYTVVRQPYLQKVGAFFEKNLKWGWGG